MKILIASDTYYPQVNGAANFTGRLAHALQQRGHTVLVIAPSRYLHQEMWQHNGVRIYGVPSVPVLVYKNFRAALPFNLSSLRQVIQEFSPDLVHVQSHFFICRSVVAIAKEFQLPVIGTNHFMPENLIHYFPVPSVMKSLAMRWAWRNFQAVFAKLDAVTTPTATAAALLKQIGFSKPVQAVSCGVDRTIFHPHHDTATLRQHYRLPATPLLLSVGRLDKEKNLDLILHALALVPPQARPHLVIVGRGTEEAALHTAAKTLGVTDNVTFAGFVPDDVLPALYCLADCFITASEAELQSLVTLEAMASGLPVIAVDAMALPELVASGDNGYLFSVGNVTELADCISKLMSNAALRQKMGQASLVKVAPHDIRFVMAQYESLYRQRLTASLAQNHANHHRANRARRQ